MDLQDPHMDEYMFVLPKNNPKQKVLLYSCKLCPIKGSIQKVGEHVYGEKHMRLASIHDALPLLHRSGLDYLDKEKKRFWCDICKTPMPVDLQQLQNHANKHVITIADPGLRVPSSYVGPTRSSVDHVHKVVQTKAFWKTYVPETVEHQQIFCPISLQDPSGELVHLVNGVFSHDQLLFLTREAQWLEEQGGATKRGAAKKGSRMVTFGVRYKYGGLAWYKHANPECYYRSEKFAQVLAEGLRKFFPSIFDHLEAIRSVQGVESPESRIGKSPFNSLSITKDYKVNAHMDDNDFSFCFFLWLGQSGTLENGNGVRFYLPELGRFFEPQIGDVMLIKANEVVHCTRTIGEPGQYGVALYLQASLVHWWNDVMGDVQKLHSGERLPNSERQKAMAWVDNNRMYQSYIGS